MAARVGSPASATSAAAPAVSATTRLRRPCRRRKSRHWPSAWTWLSTSWTSASVAPGTPSSWWFTRTKCSPTMCSPPRGSRWWTSATRPATVLSTGIMASAPGPRAPPRTRPRTNGRAGRRSSGKRLPAGHVRVGAGLALERDDAGGRSASAAVIRLSAGSRMTARPLEIGRRVDAERHRVDQPHADAHAVLRARAAAPAARAARAGSAAGREALERCRA